jgi:T5orf172 domain
MWIEISEDTITALRAQGWSTTWGGGRGHLISPEGRRYPLRKSIAPLSIYVMHAIGTTRFKVGLTRDEKTRRRGLQSGSAFKLALVCVVSIETAESEREAHALLARWHIHGEWFDLGDRAEAFLDAVRPCETWAELRTGLERVEGTF